MVVRVCALCKHVPCTEGGGRRSTTPISVVPLQVLCWERWRPSHQRQPRWCKPTMLTSPLAGLGAGDECLGLADGLLVAHKEAQVVTC